MLKVCPKWYGTQGENDRLFLVWRPKIRQKGIWLGSLGCIGVF